MPYPVRPIAERLERGKSVNGECWEWTGSYTRDGYGVMTFTNGKKRAQHRVHRVAYEHFKGESAEGKLVCHTCDNPKCFNPGHLFLGTNKENMQDMIKKGRKRTTKGEESVNAVLTEEQVLEIIEKRNVQGMKLSDIAAEYGISFQHVSTLAKGQAWAHLHSEEKQDA
jgi:hypothetical protein